jgi:hypothetical protein
MKTSSLDEKEPVRRITSQDGADPKVCQRRASLLPLKNKRIDKRGWYTGAETGRAA